MANVKWGTCSWKYPSWNGLIYSAAKGINYLEEYALKYETVEIDQWFWSLFSGVEPKLPAGPDVEQYGKAVPETFRFTVKVPNSITLTHYYSKSKSETMTVNPYFFSLELFRAFLARLEPIKDRLGPLLFQFEYLNRQKMPSQARFLEQFESFAEALPSGYSYAVELRNPNYLNQRFFDLLDRTRMHPVLMQGYWMPDITEIYALWRPRIIKQERVVIRLHGGDRADIEKKAGNRWDKIIEPREKELDAVAEMLLDLLHEEVDLYLNVNNHYEGCAPLTIQRLRSRMNR